MSSRKQRFLPTLVAIIALATVGSATPYSAEFNVPGLNAWPHGPMLARDGFPLYGSQQTSNPGRSDQASSKESDTGPSVFLPIQSRDAKNLRAGMLLVASRGLGDPRFAGTVILLVRYDAQGVLGLVLNRRTDVPLSRVLDLKAAKDRSDPVYIGGPVGPSAVFALFRSSNKIEGAESVFAGVSLISDKSVFEKTLSARPDPGVFHVYLGYAGWTKEQLRNEVELGAWFIFPGDVNTIFNSDPDSLWLQMIRKTEMEFAKRGDFLPIADRN
jgi:putative AlgH/UPF0301 family transcriptional regulator